MMRLKSRLLSLNADKTVKVKVYAPKNCEEVKIPFRTEKIAKVVGSLATIPPPTSEGDSQIIHGVLVQSDFKTSFMAPKDLREHAGLNTTIIECRQRLMLSAAGIDLIKWALEGTFGNIVELPHQGDTRAIENGNGDTDMKGSEDADEEIVRPTSYLVMDCITVRHWDNCEVDVEWEGNMINDGIADAVMAVLFSVESSPAAVKQSSSMHSHSHSHSHDLPTRNLHARLSPTERLERLFMFLEAQFGAENVSPIVIPKIDFPIDRNPLLTNTPIKKDEDAEDDDSAPPTPSSTEEEEELEKMQRKEIERLHKIGIPVPGVEIRVDKLVAKVWLETLEIECASKVLFERVKGVVEKAVEVSAPLSR